MRVARSVRPGAGALAAALLGGCAVAGPFVVPLHQVEPEGPQVTVPDRGPCRVTVAAVNDERANRETIGTAGDRAIEAKGVREWVSQSLQRLGEAAPAARPDGNPDGTAEVVTEVGMQRLYTRLVLSNLEGVVALRVRLAGPDGAITERSYRGSATRIWWTYGTFEVLLNEALTSAISRMLEDIARLCPARGGGT